jgi:competence protein ComEC
MEDDFLYHFHLEPSRILHRLTASDTISPLKQFRIGVKRILMIDSTPSFRTQAIKPHIDVLVLSKSPKLYLNQLREAVQVDQIVIDGSVPHWKAQLWKKDAETIGIPCYYVVEKGAFVMNL